METKTRKTEDGSPSSSLQASGGESAGTVSPILKKKIAPIFDAETANVALEIRARSQRFECVNGTTAEEFLAAVGI